MIICGHCHKHLTDASTETVERHFAKCPWAQKGTTIQHSTVSEGTTMTNKILCEKCGQYFNPSSYVRHSCILNATAPMLSRHMDKLSKKKRKGLMVDLSGHHGEVPQPTSESENLKQMLKQLNEIRMAKFPSIVARVRSVLMARRLRHKNNFWRRHYLNKFGVQVN